MNGLNNIKNKDLIYNSITWISEMSAGYFT